MFYVIKSSFCIQKMRIEMVDGASAQNTVSRQLKKLTSLYK